MSNTYFIKPGYRIRDNTPEYFDDVLDQKRGVIHQPEVYPFAAYLARRYACSQIIDVGCGQARKLVSLHPEFELIGIDFGNNIRYCQNTYHFGQWLEWDLDQPEQLTFDPDILQHSIIICADVIEHLVHPEHVLDQFHTWLDHAPVALITTPDRDLLHGPHEMGPPGNLHHIREWNSQELGQFLASRDLRSEFMGFTVSSDLMNLRQTSLAVLANNHRPPIEKAPPDFRVAAIMTAHNEVDIIIPVIDHLNTQGVEVYVIDNWSSDGTFELVRERIGQGVIDVERFPPQQEGEEHRFDWQQLLRRTDELGRTLDADWIIHHDSDELRESPWPDVTLRDAIYHVDQCGFNSLDHTLLEFYPEDDSFMPGDNPGEKLLRYRFSPNPADFVRINAWKNMRQSVVLWRSGGHHAQFEGQRVYPYKFLLRHYPLRTREQTVRKIKARQQGSNWLERTVLGWHHMYDRFYIDNDDKIFENVCKETHNKFMPFDKTTFYDQYLVERISGVGVCRVKPLNWTRHVPTFALPLFRFGKRILNRVLG